MLRPSRGTLAQLLWLLLLPSACLAAPVCQTDQHEWDCNSCVEDNIHHPMRNMQPFGPVPNVTAFDHKACSHILAACRTDGSGSQMQCKIATWAYAQVTGRTYVHVPISFLDHFPGEEQPRMTKGIEAFFNLGEGEMKLSEAAAAGVQPCSVMACFTFFDEYEGRHLPCWDLVKAQLLRKYYSTPKPRTFFLHDHEEATVQSALARALTIAIHIRRGDVNVFKATDGDRFNSNEYYIQVLDRIRVSLPPELQSNTLLDIVVMSEGEPSDFESIIHAYPTTRLFLNSDLFRSLHTMVSADIFVMARSSLSYVAAIYNDGISVYDPYWHRLQPGWVRNEKDNATVLVQMLNTPANHLRLLNHVRGRLPGHQRLLRLQGQAAAEGRTLRRLRSMASGSFPGQGWGRELQRQGQRQGQAPGPDTWVLSKDGAQEFVLTAGSEGVDAGTLNLA